MKKIPFNGKILVLGCGGVARCTLPLLLKHLDMPREKITILDMTDCRESVKDILAEGVRYVQERIVIERYRQQLSEYVGAGDMIIDLAWNIDCCDLLDWCHEQDVLYVNTSVELWDPYTNADQKKPTEKTLYVRHMAIRKMVAGWKKKFGATAILEHGANPGLVSHFTKMALADIAEKVLTEEPMDPGRTALESALREESFPRLAQMLNVNVIHISEIDTQTTSDRHNPHEFRNTWSVEGFREEGIAPAELGWGTHERMLPAGACEHEQGPKNQICINQFGIDTYVRSRVPSAEITGMIVRHGEAFTMSDALTVWENGIAVYRPTVHYAYCPCKDAWKSLESMRVHNYQLQDKWKILSDEIISGHDELGVLLMGHPYKSWWTGTILDINEARSLVPHQNATTLQVAASVLAAVCWMIEHPREGVLVPDQLPYKEILAIAAPYLGQIPSVPIDWTPTGTKNPTADTWQFSNFLLKGEKLHLRAMRIFSVPGKKKAAVKVVGQSEQAK